MTKIIKSKYKFLNNFQDDLTGHFLYKMKRRKRTLNLLAWRFILNKVKPVRLDDLLLSRPKRRAVVSWYTIQLRKLRYFYGFYSGYRGVFFKRLHFLIKHYKFNRVYRASSLLELRLDIILVRLGLFKHVKTSRFYLKKFGIFINDKKVYRVNYILKTGDVLSFDKTHRVFFKTKLLLKLKPALRFIKTNQEKLAPFFFKFSKRLNLFDLDLNLITFYTRLLFTNFPNIGREPSLFKSVFFVSYFPRFLEANFNTFEFFCCSKIDPSLDIKYPFKVKSNEIKKLIESTF